MLSYNWMSTIILNLLPFFLSFFFFFFGYWGGNVVIADLQWSKLRLARSRWLKKKTRWPIVPWYNTDTHDISHSANHTAHCLYMHSGETVRKFGDRPRVDLPWWEWAFVQVITGRPELTRFGQAPSLLVTELRQGKLATYSVLWAQAENELQSISYLFIPQVIVPQVSFSKTSTQN